MSNPVIMVVDDDPAVLNAVERDIRAKYGRDYRVVKANSGAAALGFLEQLQQRNEIVALFLSDQRMPQMTGIQFLDKARPLYPEAKRVLLTAYADTEVAISSINTLLLDYYLMKPWDPPEDHLYPVLTDLLEDWRAGVRLPFEGLRPSFGCWMRTRMSNTGKATTCCWTGLRSLQYPRIFLSMPTRPRAGGSARRCSIRTPRNRRARK